MNLYLIGSLRNKNIPIIARELRALKFGVFDDWYGAGETADDSWRDYEKIRGRSYGEALKGYAANHVFNFDKKYLDMSDGAVLVAPAGKSAHLELGYILGKGKPGFVLFDQEPERWDLMYLFASAVCFSMEQLTKELKSL